MQSPALLALQLAAEVHLVETMGEAKICALHGNRYTIKKKDMDLVRRIRGDRV